MALSSIELCSSALIKIGANGISSFEDGTAEARIAASLYPLIRDGLLCVHPWTFATAKVELVRLAQEPITDFAYAFELPADFLRAISAGAGRGRGLHYQIINRQLHTNADEVTLTYLFLPSEEDFPAHFAPVLVTRLAAEFCIPLTENTSRADSLHNQAQQELRLARLIDSQQDTPPRVEDFTLIKARF